MGRARAVGVSLDLGHGPAVSGNSSTRGLEGRHRNPVPIRNGRRRQRASAERRMRSTCAARSARSGARTRKCGGGGLAAARPSNRGMALPCGYRSIYCTQVKAKRRMPWRRMPWRRMPCPIQSVDAWKLSNARIGVPWHVPCGCLVLQCAAHNNRPALSATEHSRNTANATTQSTRRRHASCHYRSTHPARTALHGAHTHHRWVQRC